MVAVSLVPSSVHVVIFMASADYSQDLRRSAGPASSDRLSVLRVAKLAVDPSSGRHGPRR